jgi:heat shock protein beta
MDEILRNIKLFVRRVFITDELPDFLPRYLSFLRGLVDADDIPLNVSREQLQQASAYLLIKKKLIGKAMEMFRRLSKDEVKYNEFFKQFGTAIKLGAIEDSTHKKRLTTLLRFSSSASDNLTSLDSYIKRMKKGQSQIYFVTGISLDELKRSPLVEKPISRGYEVLYFHDPIDEYVVQGLFEYEGHKLQNVAKAGLKYGDEDDVDKETATDQAVQFEALTKWLVETLNEFIEKVVVSNKLTTSPTAIIASEYGMTGTMEKIMAAQAFQSGDNFMRDFYSKQKKIMEINPAHPIITSLLDKVQNIDSMSEADVKHLKETVHVLYETTLLRSGWDLKNTNDFASRVEKVIRTNLGVSLDATVKVDVKPAPEKETEDSSDGTSDSTNGEDPESESTPNMKVYPPVIEDEVTHDEL